jgi:hypothetical protein
MKHHSLLERVGARPADYLRDGSLDALNRHLPKDRQLVCRLPPVFSDFNWTEYDVQPKPEARLFRYFSLAEVECELRSQAEKQMFQDSLFSIHDCVYDVKEDQAPLLADPELAKLGPFYGYPQLLLKSAKDTTLGFESRFESGNLAAAYKISDWEYDLALNPDFGSTKQTCWFFFRVFNTTRGRPYRFNICNYTKSECVYNEGSRILCYSERLGQFCYLSDRLVACTNQAKKKDYSSYATLAFTMVFPEDGDTVYVMNSLPYTYSRMQSFVRKVVERPKWSNILKAEVLTKSLLGLDCPVLTIDELIVEEEPGGRSVGPTNPSIVVGGLATQRPPPKSEKKVVVIDARQHPGEPLGSHVCEVLTTLILSDSTVGKLLRERYKFYIVPMLNPDGVVLGNHRLNVAKLDLNRIWNTPTPQTCPTILAIKTLIQGLVDSKNDVFCFLDLHAHSKKYNCFFYSNPLKDKSDHVIVQLMAKHCSLYSMEDSTFKIRKEKENSARVVVWKEMGVRLSYTLEVGYGGVTQGVFKGQHHSWESILDIANGLAHSLVDMWDLDACKAELAKEGTPDLGPKADPDFGYDNGVKERKLGNSACI